MVKRPDKIDNAYDKELKVHGRDPLYVNKHESQLGVNGFITAYGWVRGHCIDRLLEYVAEVQKMRKVQQEFFSSRTDRNLKEAKRQEQRIDFLYKELISSGIIGDQDPPAAARQASLL